MADASIKVDSTLFTKKSFELLRQVEKSKPQFLQEQAGMLFRDVAKFTPPFAGGALPRFGADSYGSAKDRKAGEGAVRRDVNRSMRPVAPASKWRQPAIQKAVRRKDTNVLKQIFKNAEGSAYQGWQVDPFSPSFHSRARGSGGRVHSQHQQLVLPKTDFTRYLRKAVKAVGQGKAHFAWAAMQMGRKPAPSWLSRHFWRYRASVRRTDDYIEASATAGAFRHTLRFLPRIEKGRAEAAEKRLLYLTKQAIKKAGFRAA